MNQTLENAEKGRGVITESNYDVRSKEIFDRLGWKPIDTIPKHHEITMTLRPLKVNYIYV